MTNTPNATPDPVNSQAADPSVDRRFLLGGLAGVAGLTAFAAMARSASAGPLNPPAGGLGPTSKPLGELEPRTAVNATNTPPSGSILFALPAPGSYYLTGNITVPAGRTAINMPAGSTLDLNGFTINGAGATSVGVVAGNGCTVRNGTISNVSSAITVGISPTTSVYAEDLIVTGYTSRGIDIGGRSVVRRCVLLATGATAITGIEMQGDYGIVEDCAVTNANGTGIYLNSYSVLRRCHVTGCSIGAYIGFGSHAESCVFNACNNIGLQAKQRNVVRACVATNITVGFTGAAGAGFDIGDGGEASGCSASTCFLGIRVANATRVCECSVDFCASAAIKVIGAGNTIEACRLHRSGTAVDMIGVSGNYVHKCVMLGNSSAIGVSIGGNWYPNVALGSTNTATNPLASVIG